MQVALLRSMRKQSIRVGGPGPTRVKVLAELAMLKPALGVEGHHPLYAAGREASQRCISTYAQCWTLMMKAIDCY